MRDIKLGSLFDGAGTAPLAATMCGIKPAWASEIEPYPIKVTTARFPEMKHLGDITKIDGAAIEPVDIICGGSPCQDLSVAGKQKGLMDGERSHLFFEMTRIIKQMREATNGKYPRYIVWENAPGAFSSNNGNDFHAVLQAFAEIGDPVVHVPQPACKRNTDRLDWKRAGTIMGDGFSIAWRTVDAQYWGVPQRRRRIYLVADLGGHRAAEILFEREGVSGNLTQSGRTKEGAAGGIEDSVRAGGRECKLFEPRSTKEENWTENTIKNALRAGASKSSHVVLMPVCITDSVGGKAERSWIGNVTPTLKACHWKHPPVVLPIVKQINGSTYYIPRRMTPTEFARLQGFPDWWEDGVEGSDSARYKMWGNGMALPNMLHVMKGIARVSKEE